jgi:gliding motility-associated-like protein
MPAQSGTYVLTSTAGQCSYADSLQLVVHPAVEAAFTMSQPDLCGSGSVQFQNLSQNGLHYLWHFGDSSSVDHAFNPRHEYASPGTYSILLYAYGMGGCHDSVVGSVPVQIHPEYTPEVITQPLTPLELFLPAGTISVSEKSKSSVRWHWDFGDGSYHQELSQALHRYIRPGTYTVKLRAEDVNGCTGHWLSGPITIREPSVFIPNVFSPNADGVGDVFQIGYDGNESFHLEIFDRWGVKQFETRNGSQHWDGRNLNGTDVTPGVYFYVLQIGAQKWQGDVTVVR